MSQGLTRKEIKHDEVLEVAHDFGDWLELHWKRLAIGLTAAFVLLVLFLGWRGIQERRVVQANELLGEGERLLRSVGDPFASVPASYEQAATKFDEAASKAGSSSVGDIARYYAAVSRLRGGDASGAAGILEGLAVSAGDPLVRENARISLAASYAAQGKLGDADRLLREAAADAAATFPADQALLTLAGLYRDAGDLTAAERVVREVLERFPGSPGAQEARATLGQ